MSEPLDGTDFDRFFRAVRTEVPRPSPEQLESAPGPFPWQQRLVDELLTGSEDGRAPGRWPELLDLPTGSGKTTTIDIALFVLACRDDAPRRIVFVVDRRVVVQQAATWARALAQKLTDALAAPDETDPIVLAVARRLAAKVAGVPASDGNPRAQSGAVIAAELRGGIAADLTWAQRPDVPTVITSTVDQVGSRLLMQGYGVSDSMRPVHAGLLAQDVLFLLDEVHLSQPFADTLAAVERYRERTRESVWPGQVNRWQVVQLSATPHTGRSMQRFSLTDEDRAGVLGQRLAARKPVSVVVAPKVRADAPPHAAMARVLAESALSAAKHLETPSVIAVVANRVAIAAAVASHLKREFGRGPAPDGSAVLLLTGRMRPFERDRVLKENTALVTTGRDRRSLTHHVFIVGTQSIEAGVDFDVDALITQAASLDALKQRFGRVDRRGELAAAGRAGSNVIVCSAPSRQGGPDPVYGTALAETEKWLSTRTEVDFGIDHLVVDPDAQPLMCVLPRSAPSLLPTHLNAWAQNPTPHFAPEVAAWLHGPESESDPDVAVVWRNGLVDRDSVFAEAILDAIPIRSDEAVDVPLSHVRKWLRHDRSIDELTDVEGVTAVASSTTRDRGSAPRGFRIVTPDGTVTRGRLSDVEPGDTVIVDGAEGGLTLGSWDPNSIEPVSDLSAMQRSSTPDGSSTRSPARLDLVLAETEEWARSEAAAHVEDAETIRGWAASCPVPVADPDLPPATENDVRHWFEEMPGVLLDAIDDSDDDLERRETVQLRALAKLAMGEGRFAIIEIPSSDGPGTFAFAPEASATRVPNSDREASSTIGMPVALSAHGEDTAEWAAAFLRALHVPEEAIADHPVTFAARYHDIGKADRRFQLQLWEGQVNDLLLAKSAIPADDWRRRRAARASSGYPVGARHEMLSASMLLDSPLMERPDADLIRHLVASHHGRGRPFAPALPSADEIGPGDQDVPIGQSCFRMAPHDMISVGSPLAEWFWQSLREHGWFGNAWLTAVLRLADHQASRNPTTLVEEGTDG